MIRVLGALAEQVLCAHRVDGFHLEEFFSVFALLLPSGFFGTDL